jgi:hypothetical protein
LPNKSPFTDESGCKEAIHSHSDSLAIGFFEQSAAVFSAGSDLHLHPETAPKKK